MTQSSASAGAVSVADIRPKDLARGQVEAYERDVVRLLLRSSEFVQVRCPACDADQGRTAFVKYDCRFLSCPTCATLYMSPRPTPEVMADYYGNSENYRYWAQHIFPASEAKRRDRLHRPMLEYLTAACQRHGIDAGAMLEIGPGFGTFAQLAQQSGAFRRVITVERTPEMADACRARGLTVIQKPIEETSMAELGDIDVAVCFEVLEHLFAPVEFLSSAARLLRRGGVVLFTCPNGLGFDTFMLKERSSSVDTEHVNLFNPRSLEMLLQRCGFDVLELDTPGRLDAELVRETVTKDGAGQLDAFLRRVLVDEWETLGAPFQKFLAANRLSGHMRVLARKT